MLYKLTLGLFATAVVGEELAAPRRRTLIYSGYSGYPLTSLVIAATGKSWTDEEGNAIDLKDFKKKDLISLDKSIMKTMMKFKKKVKKIKKKCVRRRAPVAAAEGILALSKAEGEGSSKKKGIKKKYKKMTKDELIEMVSESAMDVEKAKKKLKKLKKKCKKD